MLLGFRVRNFASFRDEQVLSLWQPRHGLDSAAFPVAALYGANASGKTNLLRAMSFAQNAVVNSHRTWNPDGGIRGRSPFLLAPVDPGVTMVEFELRIDGLRYRYGFECDDASFVREWLHSFPRGKRRVLFERDSTLPDPWRFGRTFLGPNKVVAETTRKNSLYVSAAASANHAGVGPVYQWFSQHFDYIRPENRDGRMSSSLAGLEGEGASNRVQQTLAFLKAADVGIVDVRVVREPVSDRQSGVIRRVLAAINDPSLSDTVVQQNTIDDAIERASRKIRFEHQGEDGRAASFDVSDESFGTRALLALSGPVIDALRDGDCLVIDELDGSLHPHLVAALIAVFKSDIDNPHHAQLIFTTHYAALLSGRSAEHGVLERDDVWLVEKDETGASTIFPLTDFSPRQRENLDWAYLQGRYGAVPMLGRLAAAVSPGSPTSADS